jgi:hypothetical protein
MGSCAFRLVSSFAQHWLMTLKRTLATRFLSKKPPDGLCREPLYKKPAAAKPWWQSPSGPLDGRRKVRVMSHGARLYTSSFHDLRFQVVIEIQRFPISFSNFVFSFGHAQTRTPWDITRTLRRPSRGPLGDCHQGLAAAGFL